MKPPGISEGFVDHHQHLRSGGVEHRDAVDDEDRPDRRVGIVGVEHRLHVAARQGQRHASEAFRSEVGRLLDRMEGAAAAGDGAAGVAAALLVGFDFAVREGFLHILGAPPAGAERDRLAEMLTAATAPATPVLGHVLAAGWRAALAAVADGREPQEARAALHALEFRLPS